MSKKRKKKYTGSNFPRCQRLDIVQRTRLLVQHGVIQRPLWLQAAERSPPLELLNIKLLDRRVPNKYLKLTREVLKKYPNMRFADCFVDGNDWSKGNDIYRADHPVMQFVALQLRLMNLGLTQHAAFQQAEKTFYRRRIALERQQKLSMAAAIVGAVARDPAAATAAAETAAATSATTATTATAAIRDTRSTKQDNNNNTAASTATTKTTGTETTTVEMKGEEEEIRGRGASVPTSSQARETAMGLGEVQPLFTTGQAYWQFCIAQSQANHLLRIRQVLGRMRARAAAAAAKQEDPVAPPEGVPADSGSSMQKIAWKRKEFRRDTLPSLRQRTFNTAGRRSRATWLQQYIQHTGQSLAQPQAQPLPTSSQSSFSSSLDSRRPRASGTTLRVDVSAAAASPPAYSTVRISPSALPSSSLLVDEYWQDALGDIHDTTQ